MFDLPLDPSCSRDNCTLITFLYRCKNAFMRNQIKEFDDNSFMSKPAGLLLKMYINELPDKWHQVNEGFGEFKIE